MKYPFVLFIVSPSKERPLTEWIALNQSFFDCTVFLSTDCTLLNRLCDFTYHVVVSLQSEPNIAINIKKCLASERLCQRWIEMDESMSLIQFNFQVNQNYITSLACLDRRRTRPPISLFTAAYESYYKLERVYRSLLKQTLTDWEWVIVDDSPNLAPFLWIQNHPQISRDGRVRLYRRREHCGSIGLVKNEAISLSRGDILVEMDHDDELLPDCLQDAVQLFQQNPALGFLYMDFVNIHEDGSNFRYSDFLSLGYSGYYSRRINGAWRYVYVTPQINNVTASSLVSLPNHPRIWARDCLTHPFVGSYSEFLPICDDLDVLQRTILVSLLGIGTRYQIAKLNKVGYVQYMNKDGNNFSLLRNGEINRLGPQYISPHYYAEHKLHALFQEKGCYDDPQRMHQPYPIFQRPVKEMEAIRYLNQLLTEDGIHEQWGILGMDGLLYFLPMIVAQDPSVRFVVLDDRSNEYELWLFVEEHHLSDRMDVVCLRNENLPEFSGTSTERLKRFFRFVYCSLRLPQCSLFGVPKDHFSFGRRHDMLNHLTTFLEPEFAYLEIGIEDGYTFQRIEKASQKVGVDPSPSFQGPNVILKTADDYFESQPSLSFPLRLVFIDGMHQATYVIRDLVNSVHCCAKESRSRFFVVVDDVLPHSEAEQYPIPLHHIVDDKGIVKYAPGSGSWSGDVWKVVYWLLHEYSTFPFSFRPSFCSHPWHRGMLILSFEMDAEETEAASKGLWKESAIQDACRFMETLTYLEDYKTYLQLVFPPSVL
jgi:glycosyltransferase involved in cell wall biosynthesis